jgi:sugar phosphate permease
MSAATDYIIKAVGWQMAFIIEGVPSILWAFVWFFVIRDKPQQASWMSLESQNYLASALEREQALIPKISGMKSMLRKPIVVWLCMQYFLWSVGVYGFVLWLPTVIQKGASRGIAITGLLSAVPYLVAIILMLLVSHYSDRTFRRKQFVWPFLAFSGAAMLGSYFAAATSFWWAYGFLILAGGGMYAPYGPFFAIIPEMLPSNVAGEATAAINSFGGLGAFAGSWIVGLLEARTGNSRAGFLLMSVSLILAGAIIFFQRETSYRKSPGQSVESGGSNQPPDCNLQTRQGVCGSRARIPSPTGPLSCNLSSSHRVICSPSLVRPEPYTSLQLHACRRVSEEYPA